MGQGSTTDRAARHCPPIAGSRPQMKATVVVITLVPKVDGNIPPHAGSSGDAAWHGIARDGPPLQFDQAGFDTGKFAARCVGQALAVLQACQAVAQQPAAGYEAGRHRDDRMQQQL